MFFFDDSSAIIKKQRVLTKDSTFLLNKTFHNQITHKISKA